MPIGGELTPDDYNGGIHLVKPDEQIYGMQTTFGVIEITMHDLDHPITIASVSGSESFEDSKRDSICMQMGFTRAVTGSVFTVQALKEHYHFSHYHR